jgi:hypothetical protein
MKKMMTIAVLLAVIALPATALAQTGYFSWSISADNMDSNVNTPANPGAGVQTLYLWFVEGCNPVGAGESPGIQAAEFDLVTGTSDWSILAFTATNGFLNAGGATNLLLATPCVSTPVVAGNILVSSTGNPGRVGMTVSAANNKAVSVDCNVFEEFAWPGLVRFRGYATSDNSLPAQDHGEDCTTTAVEDDSWGAVKALYH